MLAGYGLVGSERAASGTNVNLWWGVVMVLFGLIMLFLSRRSMSAPPQG
jgi:hypothetical protein